MPAEPPSSSRLAPPPSSRSELPVPWQNPWGLLAVDLVAALASLRLKLRELIRRNRQGEFAAPSFWPAARRPLFWPLLLASLPLLLALLVLFATSRPPHDIAQPQPIPETSTAAAQAPEAPAAPEVTRPGSGDEPTPPAPGLFPESDPRVSAEPEPFDQSWTDRVDRSEPDPLLLRLQQGGERSPIARLVRRPAEAVVELSLNAGWAALTAERRQRLASDWLQLVRADGWESLLLIDAQGRELGRPAAVGSGMILLDPSTL